ncbi:MAG: hypothetical protein HQL60_00670 [Magnetococcales bacterium]|nr:hypothetical protein [Magnetococcales bacterium]
MRVDDDPWHKMGLFAAVVEETARIRFMVPTFPGPEMFVRRLDQPETLLRWYDILKKLLNDTVHEGGASRHILMLVDDNNLIRFPASIPWHRWPSTADRSVELAARHQDCCRSLRQLILHQRNQNQSGLQSARHQALVDLTWLINTIRGMTAPLPDQLTRFVQAHQRWVADLETFLVTLMRRGAAAWDRVETVGNFRRCELGQAFYCPDGTLWPWRHLSIVRDMEQLHKDFHATVAVEASVATALRSRSLSHGEQQLLEQSTQQRMVAIRELSHQLVQCIEATFKEIRQTDNIAQPFTLAIPEEISLAQAIANIEMWETRIQRFISAPFDTAIDKILLHTSCPTGKRIDGVMDDPVRFGCHAALLEQVDVLHRNQHATAASIVAFVRHGQPDQARMLLNKLGRDCHHLIDFMRQSGSILNIKPDRV